MLTADRERCDGLSAIHCSLGSSRKRWWNEVSFFAPLPYRWQRTSVVGALVCRLESIKCHLQSIVCLSHFHTTHHLMFIRERTPLFDASWISAQRSFSSPSISLHKYGIASGHHRSGKFFVFAHLILPFDCSSCKVHLHLSNLSLTPSPLYFRWLCIGTL